MTPFGNAMGLVDGDKTDAHRLQEFDVFCLGQAFRRHVQQLGPALSHIHLHPLCLRTSQGRIQEMGHSLVLVVSANCVDLILHECNERTDHKGHTIHHECGQLVAHRLASTRGHDDKGVPSVKHTLDGLLLLTLEFVESKIRFQRLLRRNLYQAHLQALALLRINIRKTTTWPTP